MFLFNDQKNDVFLFFFEILKNRHKKYDSYLFIFSNFYNQSNFF